jgi:hypothetical protein
MILADQGLENRAVGSRLSTKGLPNSCQVDAERRLCRRIDRSDANQLLVHGFLDVRAAELASIAASAFISSFVEP